MRDRFLTVRLRPDELERLELVARLDGRTVSEYVRSALHDHIAGGVEVGR